MINMFLSLIIIIATILVFIGARKLYFKYPKPFLNPMLISTIIIVAILCIFHIPYSTYMLGGKWIHELLSATVVALAYPLYKHRDLLLKNYKLILTSILTGILVNLMTILLLVNALGFSKKMLLSAFPKSITTAVALEVSSQTGGIPSLTAVFVMLAGFTGAILGPIILKTCHFQSDMAKGLALGNASHAFGTARAFEYGLETGSISSAGMILTAVFSGILIPLITTVFF